MHDGRYHHDCGVTMPTIVYVDIELLPAIQADVV